MMRRPRTANALRGPPSSMCDIIRYGYFRQVRFLVNAGTDLECREAHTRRTPLMLCALMEPPEWGASIAMTLLEAGVRPGLVDSRGHNVLHLACIWCRERLVRVVLRAIDFDLGRQDRDGNTALHLAAMSGNVPVTQLVAQAFRKYCMNVDKTNTRGLTACQEAMRAGYTACAQAINFAVSAKRPCSATKDVRFAAPTLKCPALCSSSSNNINLSSRSDEDRKLSGNTGSVRSHHQPTSDSRNGGLLNKTSPNGSNCDIYVDEGGLSMVNRASSVYGGGENIAPPTEGSNDSVFTENLTPVPDVLRSVQSPRNSKTVVRSPRPMTAAFLTRHDSYSTLTSSEEKRSTVSYPGRADNRVRKRKSQNPLYCYGYKKDADVIQCAPESDFRNTAEFVRKIAHLPPGMTQSCPLMDTIDQNGPWMSETGSPVSRLDQIGTKEGWRRELKSIFKVYEHQCSPSWRSGRKLEFRPITPDLSAQEECEKARRGRRPSVISRIFAPSLLRRPSVAIRPKRSSSTASGHGKGSDSGLDSGRDTGSEAMTSPIPGRRRSGHQLDASIPNQGPRSDYSSTKVKTENSSDDSVPYLPTLSEQADKAASKAHELVKIGDTNGVTHSRSQQSLGSFSILPEVPNLQQATEDVRNVRPKSIKGVGKPAAETTSSLREEFRAKRNNSSKSRTDIPRVNEILVHDPLACDETDCMDSVDTSKLLVPDLYNDDEDDGDDNHV